LTATTSNTAALLSPEQVEELLVLPILASSVALDPRVSTVVRLTGSTYRIPKVSADPSASWVAEGAEIPASDLTTNELVITPSKVAGLSVITSELAEDSSPEATTEVGAGLARDISRKIDAAFFGGVAANTPSGLASLTVGAGNSRTSPPGPHRPTSTASPRRRCSPGTSARRSPRS
jgi:HK97 family phage major capsid protein